MSKRKTIDAFLKKKDVSNSKFRTPMTIETNVVIEINVNTSMPDEQTRWNPTSLSKKKSIST